MAIMVNAFMLGATGDFVVMMLQVRPVKDAYAAQAQHLQASPACITKPSLKPGFILSRLLVACLHWMVMYGLISCSSLVMTSPLSKEVKRVKIGISFLCCIRLNFSSSHAI